MKEEVLIKIKEVEEKLAQGSDMDNEDIIFLFALGMIRDGQNE